MNEPAYTFSRNINQRILRLLVLTAIALVLTCSLHLTAWAADDDKKEEAAPPAVKEESMADKWGIEITSIRMSAHGYMVDFRYRVLDEEKSKTLFVRENKPYLIDQASGKVLEVPKTAKVGPLRSSYQPQKGRIYWMFFGNRGGFVKAGSKVTVVIGDFRAENLTVE